MSGLSGRPLHETARVLAAVAGACLMMMLQPAHADELEDVTRLVRAGKPAEAMVRIDAFLVKQPRDLQMRFVKGVVLTEQGKTAEAITVFTKMTEDHPELPEPYNNLAVLFAASGQYDKARAALDMAIRTNPSYATAYENLGDVHARLASQAYDKALQLDSANSHAKSKLTLLKTLAVNGANQNGGGRVVVNPVASATPAATAAATAAAIAAATAAAGAQVTSKNDIAPPAIGAPPAIVAPAVVATPAAIGAPPAIAIPTVVATKPEPSKPSAAVPATTTAPKPEPQGKPESRPPPKLAAVVVPVSAAEVKQASTPTVPGRERDEVLAAVNDWADAWSAQDMKRYLGHYASDFETPKGEPRKTWADERTSRIVGKGRISVKVDSPQVSISSSTATVKFRQVYSSDQLQADSRKILVLTRQGTTWQIRQERTGT
ncbi:MAG: tetratricopeptide repeat protein [Herminiimonas sp.]|nr:tetratricopeptide repeat protein [Herminiimonas sp.]